jgi:protein-tyrosine phosphatase
MDWITDEVAIGNYLEAQDATLLKQSGIRSVVSLDGTLSAKHAAELGLIELALYRLIDGAGNDLRVLGFAIDDLLRLARTRSPVLVHCHAGRSRSAVVAAGYLMRLHGIGPAEAIAAIAAKREINVTPALVELLHKLEV